MASTENTSQLRRSDRETGTEQRGHDENLRAHANADSEAARLGSIGRVDNICVVHQLSPDTGNVGTTAIDKRPVEGSVKVRKLGLFGDVQADRKNHGGEDKAVYAYSEESARWWAAELDREVAAGFFGENLVISGFDVDAAHPGERWQIGDDVVLEVTMPRTPCATFARRVKETRWVKRFADSGRPGTYLKVITTGQITAGDAVEIVRAGDVEAPSIREVALRA